MKVYKYDTQTKEFLEELEINEAYGSNLPFATTIKPLTKKDGFAICFNGTKWEYVEDNRDNTVYVKDTKQELKVDYLGKIKDEHTLLIPKQFDEWDYTQNQWIENVEKKETQRVQQIESKAETLRAERDAKIEAVRWRIERYSDELALGIEPLEPLEPLLQYVQELRDVPQQTKFPESVEWPEIPSEG